MIACAIAAVVLLALFIGAERRSPAPLLDLAVRLFTALAFVRLGIFGRWWDPYLTLSADYEATIAQAFVDILDQGYVYKGLKPVNWCLSCQTALAEAEVEYDNHSSPSIWVRFRLTSDPKPASIPRTSYSAETTCVCKAGARSSIVSMAET